MYRASNRPYGRVEGSDEIRTIPEDCKCAGFTQLNTKNPTKLRLRLRYKLLQRISVSTEALNKIGVLYRQKVGRNFGNESIRLNVIRCNEQLRDTKTCAK